LPAWKHPRTFAPRHDIDAHGHAVVDGRAEELVDRPDSLAIAPSQPALERRKEDRICLIKLDFRVDMGVLLQR
jgi:hypothetical protein